MRLQSIRSCSEQRRDWDVLDHPGPLSFLGQHPWIALRRTSFGSVPFHGVSHLFRYQDLPDPDKPSGILPSTEALQLLGLFLQRWPRSLGRAGAPQAVPVWGQQDRNKLGKHHWAWRETKGPDWGLGESPKEKQSQSRVDEL